MRAWVRIIAASATLLVAGCSFFGVTKVIPPPLESPIQSPYDDVHTFAIAPAINLSGTQEFDPLTVSDTLFAEMQQVQGLNVLPLNKTLLAMQRLGVRNIDDPRIAQQLATMMGVDGLVIPAVTAYNPYNPPTIGMILQIYTPVESLGTAKAPADAPVKIKTESLPPNSTDVAVAEMTDRPPQPLSQPVAQVNAVFNSTNQTVLHELQSFSRGRTEYESALQDQKFIVDADSYLRFVCHAMVQRLMDVERTRLADR